jgi:proteasome lid subunit RPN8/RPN11
VRIGRALLDEMIAHAKEENPNECCGLVSAEPGMDGQAVRIHRAINVFKTHLRFEIDGLELKKILDDIEHNGLKLGALYHSHTRTEPKPSQTDISRAKLWPGVEWIIVGLADGEAPEVRSYLIEDGQVREVALEVE